MNRDKTQCHPLFAYSMLLALFVGPTFSAVSIARANPAPDGAAATATFRANCAACHGEDGVGSAAGKSLHVPDLRSAAVQKLPDAELARIISDGKSAMPAFKGSLSEDQIHALVTHVRSLRQRK
ncbi:MAG TPA: cytochrome c [Candidatus Acidoferrales bacterium]|nr:cytochrome c [Candidatus Acidoferrales bacterium]